jgi:GTP-binding protein
MPKIAVVGKPNAGKSTLINSLLGKKRLIVSPVPGTTRDAIDSICTYYGKKYLFIDTAGIRKKAREYSIEGFSVIRAVKSIERADVVLIVLDISQGITEQDQKIAGIVEEYGKSAIFLINKWDLVENPDAAYKTLSRELKNIMWFMDYVPFLTISGMEKKRITKIFPLIDEIISERKKRISTGALNKFLAKAIESNPFPRYKGKEVKLFYMTQVAVEPPAFTIFANYPAALKGQHLRYLEKALREEYSFKGTPIRIYAKPR